MKTFTEMMSHKKNYCKLHIASGMAWGVAIVLIHFSILTDFWTINTYFTLAWALLVQVVLSLYYRRTTFSVIKGLGIAALSAVITIALLLVTARHGL